MSDTPETDLASQSWLRIRTNCETFIDENKIVPADFTRNLERQRNDALKLARELRDALDDMLMLRWPGSRGTYVETTEKAESALTKANQILK